MSSEHSSHPWLIASLSGRGLAKAAHRAGQPVRGIDGFADCDACSLSDAWARVPLSDAYSLKANALLSAAKRLCPPERSQGLVYGAGFESQPKLLARLAKDRRLYGNAPETLAHIADPARFFPLLRQLGIPHPEVKLTRPARSFGWLSKLAGACGGSHILPASASGNRHGQYFQDQVKGQAGSLLFLADGHEICPIGYNRPLPAPPEAPSVWAYSGATRLTGAMTDAPDGLLDAARALTKALGLKGLNGIDFIVNNKGNNNANDQRWWLIELNPRPTATVELWDVAPMPSLFKLHVEACDGRLPSNLPSLTGSLTSAVVYSAESLRIPIGFVWPDWCSDLPAPGNVIAGGEPLCTVRAAGNNPLAAELWAGELRHSILRRLSHLQPCDRFPHSEICAPALPQSSNKPTTKPAWA